MIRIIIFFALMVSTISYAQQLPKITDSGILVELNSLYEKQDFFTLKSQFESNESQLSKEDILYYKALINNVFNQQKASNEAILELLHNHKEKLTKLQLSEIYQAKLLNHLNLYEYAQAAAANRILLENYKSFLDASQIEDFQNELSIWEALKDTPRQELIKNKDCIIPMTRDNVGLMNIDVSFSGKKLNFIFDTGANFSAIKRSLVEELGLKIVEADFYVTAATGVKVKSDLAIAEILTIGEMTCKNVVFLILEDEDFSFPQVDYFPNGAIGFPVIEAFDEIHFDKEGQLFVPKTPIRYSYNNLALDGLMPIIAGIHEGDTLNFGFDTGATNTSLYPAYYKKYRQNIEEKHTKENLASGSAGGQVDFEGYTIPKFSLTIAESTATLDSLLLHIEDIGGKESNFHGNFGQDFIKQFDKMIISFKHSAVVFE